MDNTKVLYIIPARGGSKGIPLKNIKMVGGKPLLAHSIEQARCTKRPGRIVVSTDAPEIADVATRFGAEIVWRPAELSGDKSTSEAALLHTLDVLKEKDDYEPDLVVFLQCTSPLTLAKDIDGVIDSLLENAADTALAVTPFHYFLWRKDEEGNAVGINHDKNVRYMRQDQEIQLLETGSVYVMKTDGFRLAKHRFFGKTAMYIMPEERCYEIDEPVDMQIAEVLLRQRQNSNKQMLLPNNVEALIMDFDGVLTDNKVYVNQDSIESVCCDRSDGRGLSMLRQDNVRLVVMSTEVNPVVAARCDKLGVECYQGLGEEKYDCLIKWCSENEIDISSVIYVGNDDNDIDCLREAGCGVVPADAYPEAKNVANVILERNGGNAAVRELCDMILPRKKL